MPRAAANVGRVSLGVLLLFVAWVAGGFVGSLVFPDSVLVGGRETLAGKVGCSAAILAAALIIRRYILRSFGLALVCLAATEVIVLFIVMSVSGLTTLTLTDIRFNGWWVYALTWNVVVAFLVGITAGHFWDRRAANQTVQATAAAPGS
jgi:hypothetical protein